MSERLTRRNFLKIAATGLAALGLTSEVKAFAPEDPEAVVGKAIADVFKETEPAVLAEKLAKFILDQGKFFARAAEFARKNFNAEIPMGMDKNAIFYIGQPTDSLNIGVRTDVSSDWVVIAAKEGKYGPWLQLIHLKGSSAPQNGIQIAALAEFGMRDDEFTTKRHK